MNKVKRTNYWLLTLLLVTGYWLLATGASQSQASNIEITLTWTTDTYTPLDYPGRALPSRSSNIEVVAQLDSLGLNPQNLVYNWFLNNHIKKANSGLGKNVFKFNIGESVSKTHTLMVEVYNQEDSLIGSSAELVLEAKEPEIILKTNPLTESLRQYQFSGEQEINFTAQPYFFNIKNVDELNYQWSFGQQAASQVDNENLNKFILAIGKIAKSIDRELSVWAENKSNSIQRTQTYTKIILTP